MNKSTYPPVINTCYLPIHLKLIIVYQLPSMSSTYLSLLPICLYLCSLHPLLWLAHLAWLQEWTWLGGKGIKKSHTDTKTGKLESGDLVSLLDKPCTPKAYCVYNIELNGEARLFLTTEQGGRVITYRWIRKEAELILYHWIKETGLANHSYQSLYGKSCQAISIWRRRRWRTFSAYNINIHTQTSKVRLCHFPMGLRI